MFGPVSICQLITICKYHIVLQIQTSALCSRCSGNHVFLVCIFTHLSKRNAMLGLTCFPDLGIQLTLGTNIHMSSISTCGSRNFHWTQTSLWWDSAPADLAKLIVKFPLHKYNILHFTLAYSISRWLDVNSCYNKPLFLQRLFEVYLIQNTRTEGCMCFVLLKLLSCSVNCDL